MKLICLPWQSRHFYLKPDTAILRSGRTFYIPEQSARIEGVLALVVKIDRLGRHIAARFASRYYNETALGFCLYAADILEQNRVQGVSWGEACSFDYSAPLSDLFRNIIQYPVKKCTFSWKSATHIWEHTIEESTIDSILSHLSQYIFLKMGDLIWIELHHPVALTAGDEIRAFRNDFQELCFSVQ